MTKLRRRRIGIRGENGLRRRADSVARQSMAAGVVAGCVLMAGCVPTPQNGEDPPDSGPSTKQTLMIFHNNTGPMCLEALDWLDDIQPQYPDLVVEEKLTFEQDTLQLLEQMKAQYGQSQGVSNSYEYLPIIFFEGRAFSGFNDDIATSIRNLLTAD